MNDDVRDPDDLARLARWEQVWRDQPMPDMLEARSAFLNSQTRTPASGRRSGLRVPPWAVAASLFLIISVGLIVGTRPVRADNDVVQRLIDWNVQIAETDGLAERERLYASRAAELERELSKTRLSEDDRQLAATLLENGSWLARNVEPIDEAVRFEHVADQLVDRMHKSTKSRDPKQAEKHAKQYQFVVARAIQPQREKAKAAKAERLDKLKEREAKRQQRIEKLLDATPEPTRKRIRPMLQPKATG